MVDNGSYHQTMNHGHLETTFDLNASNFGIIYEKVQKTAKNTHFLNKLGIFRPNGGI